MKKFLILTVTAGQAHNACAAAMARRLEESGASQVEIVDLFGCFSPKRVAWLSDRGYSLVVEKLLPLYNLFYEHYKHLDPAKRYSNATQHVCLSALGGLMRKMLEFQPDAVFCTHYNCAVALCDLKLVFPLPCKIFATCLDYTLSPFWESAVGIDLLFVPHEDMVFDCLDKGYTLKQLAPVGYPVRIHPIEHAKKQQDAPFCVLLSFGGGNWKGIGKLFSMTLAALGKRRADVIVINGKNEKSFRRIAKKKYPENINVTNLAYTDNISALYARADVAIGKCGGASAAELAAAGVPMLIYERIPAQEKYNLQFFKRNNAAFSFRNRHELNKRLSLLYDSPETREMLSSNAGRIVKNGWEKAASSIYESPGADWKPLLSNACSPEEIRKLCRNALKKADKQERLHRKYPFLKDEHTEWEL